MRDSVRTRHESVTGPRLRFERALKAPLGDVGSNPASGAVQGDAGRLRQADAAVRQQHDEAAGRRYRWFTTEDLRWLVRLGYAEKRVMRGVHVYRLTVNGATLEPLRWKLPRETS